MRYILFGHTDLIQGFLFLFAEHLSGELISISCFNDVQKVLRQDEDDRLCIICDYNYKETALVFQEYGYKYIRDYKFAHDFFHIIEFPLKDIIRNRTGVLVGKINKKYKIEHEYSINISESRHIRMEEFYHSNNDYYIISGRNYHYFKNESLKYGLT